MADFPLWLEVSCHCSPPQSFQFFQFFLPIVVVVMTNIYKYKENVKKMSTENAFPLTQEQRSCKESWPISLLKLWKKENMENVENADETLQTRFKGNPGKFVFFYGAISAIVEKDFQSLIVYFSLGKELLGKFR